VQPLLERGYKAQLIGDSERPVFICCGKWPCRRRLYPNFDWGHDRVVFECTDRCRFRHEARLDRYVGALRRASDQGLTRMVPNVDF
jgi:hypothetical protein